MFLDSIDQITKDMVIREFLLFATEDLRANYREYKIRHRILRSSYWLVGLFLKESLGFTEDLWNKEGLYLYTLTKGRTEVFIGPEGIPFTL